MYEDRKFIHTRYGGCNVIALLNHDFELIEDNNIDINKLSEFIIPEIAKAEESDMWTNRIKINKLIQAVKQLNKEIKELKKIGD